MKTIHLTPEKVHFFFSRVDRMKTPEFLARCRAVLSQAERIKTDRYLFEKDRLSCLITRALLRCVLSASTDLPPEAFEFIENAYGKPALKPGSVPVPVRFNLSHSGVVAACVLTAESEVGLDVENIERGIDLGLADRFFTSGESDYVRTRPAEDRPRAFFELWTLKEAYMKARGMGLSIGLDQFGFTLGRETAVHFNASLNDAPDRWRFFRFEPLDHYLAAVAVRANAPAAPELHVYECIPFVEIREISLRALP